MTSKNRMGSGLGGKGEGVCYGYCEVMPWASTKYDLRVQGSGGGRAQGCAVLGFI